MEKSGYFLDEIYSYGLSNSYEAPFLRLSVMGGTITDKTITSEAALDCLAVDPDGSDAFAYGSVLYNQSQDVHPPLLPAHSCGKLRISRHL